MVAIAFKRSGELGSFGFFLFLLFGLAALVFAVFSLALIIIPVGRVLFSNLTLSDEGLVYQLWPLHKIRCTWNDVEEIKKSPIPFHGDLLILKDAEVLGFHLLMDFNKGKFGVTPTIPVIPIYRFNGWHNGRLEDECRKFAPRLFVRSTLI